MSFKSKSECEEQTEIGCILRDNEKRERLVTKDKNRTVEAYATSTKARSAIYENESDDRPLPLIDAFQAASLHNPQASKIWLEKLENVTINDVREVFERIPEERISDVAKEFAIRLLEINRRRLLELK